MATAFAMEPPFRNAGRVVSLAQAWQHGDRAGFELELRGLPHRPEFRDMDAERGEAFAGIMEQLDQLLRAPGHDDEATGERVEVCLSLLSHIAGIRVELA